MMKRVRNTRFGVCAILLAVFLLVGGVGAPAFAKYHISSGEAGDPGDGLDYGSGGGSGESQPDTDTDILEPGIRIIDIPEITVVLVPVFDGVMLRFFVLINSDLTGKSLK